MESKCVRWILCGRKHWFWWQTFFLFDSTILFTSTTYHHFRILSTKPTSHTKRAQWNFVSFKLGLVPCQSVQTTKLVSSDGNHSAVSLQPHPQQSVNAQLTAVNQQWETEWCDKSNVVGWCLIEIWSIIIANTKAYTNLRWLQAWMLSLHVSFNPVWPKLSSFCRNYVTWNLTSCQTNLFDTRIARWKIHMET